MEENKAPGQNTINMEDEKRKHKRRIILMTIFCLIMAIYIFLLVSWSDVFTREATMDDLYINTSQEISLSIKYELIPNKTIKDLELTFKYYDGNNKLQSSKVEKIGKASKNVKYTIIVSLSEFSLSQIANMKYVSCQVSNGRVFHLI